MSNVILSKPSEKTWFIGWDGERTEVKTYGVCDVTQTLRSPWSEMDFYTDEDEWKKALEDNGIELESADDTPEE
tara:strand:+ start:15144 stop:15365 length:222 start_codon:yes stop_codon:yes gene_type:complete